MGYLVLQRINDNTSIIIDGQQRLTTITLIIIAALYQLKELVENNDHPEDNQRRLEALQRSYIGALNPVSVGLPIRRALSGAFPNSPDGAW